MRSRRVPKQQFPTAAEERHVQVARRLARELSAMIEALIVREIDAFVDEPKEDSVERMDARSPRPVLDRIFRTWENSVSSQRTKRQMERTAKATDRFNRKQVNRQMQAVIGIDLAVAEPFVAGAVQGFVQQNTSLITKMGRKELNKVERLVREAQKKGQRVESIGKLLESRLQVAESRAILIARDQMGKLNAQLTQARHQSLGIESYIWRTVGDDRVRDEHVAIDGNKYTYAKGAPGEGNPGEPIQCRCTAEPVINQATLNRAEKLAA